MGRVAAVQMSSTPSIEENLNTIKRLAAEAAAQKAELVVLPENVALISNRQDEQLEIAELLGRGPLQSFFSKLAEELNVWLAGGTLPLKCEGTSDRVYAACCIWDNQGQLRGHYNKIHLFDVIVPPATEYTES